MESSLSPLQGLYKPTQLSQLYYGPSIVSSSLLSCLPSPSSRAYIITGSSLASKTPLVKDVEKLLGDRHAGTFSRIGQHAPVAAIDDATAAVLADTNIDTLISIGGGSPIDSAKAISHRWHEHHSSASSPDGFKGYLWHGQHSSSSSDRYLWHIAIPTTLSAAECSGTAGFTDASGTKTGVAAPQLVPQAVLYDSGFVAHTPPHLFLSTGLRALDHALEALYNPTATELTRAMALHAAAQLCKYLPKYAADNKDADAVGRLQLAAYASLGFLGLNTKGGLGLSHALGYALGSPYGIPHGVTSCITLGKVLKLKARTDEKAAGQIVRAAEAVGVQRTGNDKEDAIKVGEAVEELVERLGLKTDLAYYKVDKKETDTIVKTATRSNEGPVFDAVKGLVETLW